ncbi:acetyl esterase [Sphingomonas laterariae]|uniref:Acetyl esterase n=1 Tax=Edaphosphingomonas laterariae TaxID=861865 RepID=A0A239D0V1_9SPHN|nr:alpha/beta hydrolase [Sphingomonas laterariae]SNS26136.1 acetyl esterase [Sphingomonas laterariae]
MALDPMVQQILEMMKQSPLCTPPFTVANARVADDMPMPFPKADIAAVKDIVLKADGREVPARLYHPEPGQTLPVLVFFHGGGWVSGNLETHDPLARAIAEAAHIAVVSVDYPRAPEAPFPGPLDACYAAVRAVAEGQAGADVDGTRIAVGGDSAGGNLAAAVALKAREAGPKIAHQFLIYPVIDSDFDNASYTENGTDYFLTGPMMRWFWEQYVGEANVANPDPLAAPIRAASLAGLPAATIVTAELDPLRDEGEAYAEKLEEAGVAVTLRRADGMFHGFASMVGVLPASAEAIQVGASDLRRSLGDVVSA